MLYLYNTVVIELINKVQLPIFIIDTFLKKVKK